MTPKCLVESLRQRAGRSAADRLALDTHHRQHFANAGRDEDLVGVQELALVNVAQIDSDAETIGCP